MVPRDALGVRVPKAQVRRVAIPSERINLNQGVRVPWTVRITRRLVDTLNETFGSTSTPNHYIYNFGNFLHKIIRPRATE